MLSLIFSFILMLFLLFLPGIALTYAFFKEINLIERLLLSLLFSITIIPFLLLLENKVFQIKINLINSLITLTLILIISIILALIKNKEKIKLIAK